MRAVGESTAEILKQSFFFEDYPFRGCEGERRIGRTHGVNLCFGFRHAGVVLRLALVVSGSAARTTTATTIRLDPHVLCETVMRTAMRNVDT